MELGASGRQEPSFLPPRRWGMHPTGPHVHTSAAGRRVDLLVCRGFPYNMHFLVERSPGVRESKFRTSEGAERGNARAERLTMPFQAEGLGNLCNKAADRYLVQREVEPR